MSLSRIIPVILYIIMGIRPIPAAIPQMLESGVPNPNGCASGKVLDRAFPTVGEGLLFIQCMPI